ncbi:acyl-CoA carboxylase subunit epsilon [Streptomyces sp. A0642]|uniref:acyl-CoA carboxylase subunit epsilon n=1 Tax=Streptomyces sp. A0642 TaxID=2563100 RepID=UPI0010A2070B|nr:acyl-CoA carboxylase subunit epsilon [Streptomyces sp. A0642]THA77743.1 acyl-CoA carboxylase subunit epsilon [Streptomyces sp. A0642]
MSGFRLEGAGVAGVARVERGRANQDELSALNAALLSVLARNRVEGRARRDGAEGRPAGWRRWEQAPYRAPQSWR